MKDYGKNFDEDVKIDRFTLDEDSEVHPSIYDFWSEKLADAKARKDRTEEIIKREKAKLDIKLRKGEIIVYDIKDKKVKLTEGMIKSYIEADNYICSLVDDYLNARREVYEYSQKEEALQHRKSEIDVLSKLYQSGYYSLPEGYKQKRQDEYNEYNAMNRRKRT